MGGSRENGGGESQSVKPRVGETGANREE